MLHKAHNYIPNHFREPIELNYLTSLSNVSAEHFCRLFKNTFYLTPFEYITNLRMQEAKKLLAYTNYNISKIGHDVGYKSPSYFIHVFKAHTFMTPTEFRKTNNILKKP